MMRPPAPNEDNELPNLDLAAEFSHYLPKYEELMEICREYHAKKILPEFNLGKAEALLREMETDGKTNFVARYFVVKYYRESISIKKFKDKKFEIIKVKADLSKWKSEFKLQLQVGKCDEMSYLSLASLSLIDFHSSRPNFRDVASGLFLTAILLDFDTTNILVKDILKSMDFYLTVLATDDDNPTYTRCRLNRYKPVILKNVKQYEIDSLLQSFYLEHVKSEPLRIKITDHFRTILLPEKKPENPPAPPPTLTSSTSFLFAQKTEVNSPIQALEEEIRQLRRTLLTKETQLAEMRKDAEQNTLRK